MNSKLIEKPIIQYLILTAGTLAMSAGIYFFKFPNGFCMGGVSGISMILGAIAPKFSAGTVMLMINVALLIVGAIVFGRNFGIKTVYCSLLLSLSLSALEIIIPMKAPLTDEPMLEFVFAVLLPALGSAVIFNLGGTTGGTDIVAMILKKYTSIHIGAALFCVDAIIVACGFFVFGIKAGLFSALGLLSKALVVDGMIDNINISKYFFIITTHPDEVCRYINDCLHKSATIWRGVGSYTHEDRTVILAVMTRTQAVSLRNHIKAIDSHAFVVISSTSDIIGKGFREVT